MIQPYFDEIEERILEVLNNSQYAVHVAVAWLTNQNLLKKLIELKANKIDVRVVVSADDHINEKSAPFFKILDEDFPCVYKAGNELWAGNKLMHHKFCVVDYQTVITGSFNWTEKAEQLNDENILILEDWATAKKYENEFFEVLQQAELFFGSDLPPTQVSFFATKLLVGPAEEFELRWHSEPTSQLKINGLEVERQGRKTYSILEHSVFVLQVQNSYGVSTQQVYVEVCHPPEITFELDREFVVENHVPLKISWDVLNAQKVYLHPIGEVEAQGEHTAFIKEATTYYLLASNRKYALKSELRHCKVVSINKLEQIEVPFPEIDLKLALDLTTIKDLQVLFNTERLELNLAQSYDEIKNKVYIENQITLPKFELDEVEKLSLIKKVQEKLFGNGTTQQ